MLCSILLLHCRHHPLNHPSSHFLAKNVIRKASRLDVELGLAPMSPLCVVAVEGKNSVSRYPLTELCRISASFSSSSMFFYPATFV